MVNMECSTIFIFGSSNCSSSFFMKGIDLASRLLTWKDINMHL